MALSTSVNASSKFSVSKISRSARTAVLSAPLFTLPLGSGRMCCGRTRATWRLLRTQGVNVAHHVLNKSCVQLPTMKCGNYSLQPYRLRMSRILLPLPFRQHPCMLSQMAVQDLQSYNQHADLAIFRITITSFSSTSSINTSRAARGRNEPSYTDVHY